MRQLQRHLDGRQGAIRAYIEQSDLLAHEGTGLLRGERRHLVIGNVRLGVRAVEFVLKAAEFPAKNEPKMFPSEINLAKIIYQISANVTTTRPVTAHWGSSVVGRFEPVTLKPEDM